MATFPGSKDGKIEYFEQRIDQWAADPAAVGLTLAQVTELATLIADARTTYTSVQLGKQDVKNLVFTQDTAIDTMMNLGTAIVSTIRAFADTTTATDGATAGAAIFSAANLSPYSNGTPTPPPTPATNLQASLLNTGGLKLTWDGTIANGTVYTIWRRAGTETNFSQVGISGQRFYEDQTIPAGSTEAVYFLQTVRDEFISDDSELITVRLGVVNNAPATVPLTIAA